MLALALLFSISFASAFSVTVPSQVDIHDQEYISIQVTNISSELKTLKINFFAPTETQIFAPTEVSPNQTITARILVKNTLRDYTEINSKLEIYLGSDLVEKELLLRYYPSSEVIQQEQQENNNKMLGALFGFSSFFTELGNFSLVEWVALVALVIIAAFLLVALIARAVRRA